MIQLKIDRKYLERFVNTNEIDAIADEVMEAQKILNNGSGKGNDFLGWITLPDEIDADLIARIKHDADLIAQKAKVYVVVGIGGSYLGARAVIEALQSELSVLETNRTHPYIIYAGHTLSEDYYAKLIEILDNTDYALTVISKSGTTTEPAVAFRILKKHLEKKYGVEEARTRIIAITDQKKGALHNIAQKEGYSMYVIPDNVGGRYSVLTPVGLLPIAVAGYDIETLIKGAQEMHNIVSQEISVYDNPALLYAAIRNILYRKGKKIEMMVAYEPTLRFVAEWWKQLYGESEGKDGKGILPHSVTFTTDLHSMGQYIQDGERIIMETVLKVNNSSNHVNIPYDEADGDGLNYLQQKTLTEINHCASEGTAIAHVDGGVPVTTIEMERINEEIIGQLFYMMEYACGVSGYILKVNPFDQPGVEAYKRNMFHLLGKKGY
ncbi:MAG: glucose-6-phosphate isomerase [Bacteroidales bacterium]|nr:glucose-6-phosphate isomerase [Bacteroidales bacterium]